MSGTGSTLLESASLTGRYRYVELVCFELLGKGARGGDVTFGPYLSASAQAHAFRAELFAELLPVSVGLPGAAELTASPGADFDHAMTLLGGLAPKAALASVVKLLYPAMLDGWRQRLAAASPFADPPLARTLRRAVADLEAVHRQGIDLVGEDGAATFGLSALADPFGQTRATAMS